MPTFRSSRQVRHSPADMFNLVADVEKYPLFLPLCEALKVRRRTMSDDGVEILIADMSVGYRAIHETFTSRVTLDRPRLKILGVYRRAVPPSREPLVLPGKQHWLLS